MSEEVLMINVIFYGAEMPRLSAPKWRPHDALHRKIIEALLPTSWGHLRRDRWCSRDPSPPKLGIECTLDRSKSESLCEEGTRKRHPQSCDHDRDCLLPFSFINTKAVYPVLSQQTRGAWPFVACVFEFLSLIIWHEISPQIPHKS